MNEDYKRFCAEFLRKVVAGSSRMLYIILETEHESRDTRWTYVKVDGEDANDTADVIVRTCHGTTNVYRVPDTQKMRQHVTDVWACDPNSTLDLVLVEALKDLLVTTIVA